MRKGPKIFVWGWICAAFVVGSVSAQTSTGQVQKVPQRSEIPDKYKWRLQDIYPTDSLWEYDFSRVEKLMPQMDRFKGHLSESGQVLLNCLVMQDSIWNIMDRVYVYSFLKLDEDNRAAKYQELSDRAAKLNTRLKQATSFISPEILTIPDIKLSDWMGKDKRLTMYRHYVDDILRQKAHTLSVAEEDLLAQTADMARVPGSVFTMIDDADIKYPSVKDEQGNEVELTKERYSKFLESTDRRLRKDAADAYNHAYLAYLNALGADLAGSITKDIFYARARKYGSSLEAALYGDNIPTQVFDNLVTTVDQNLAPIHRYVSLRKKVMKLEELHKYDLWVPLVPQAKMEIPYDSAVTLVLNAVKPLGEKYQRDLRAGFNSGWVDVYETEGKGSGAYSWGSYSTHPYMLLNYNNTLEWAFTVAHEMGHNMHGLYSRTKQPYIYGSSRTFVSEVASTMNEALLMDYLLKNAKDKEQKLYLLNYYIEMIMGTFYGQVMFNEFEKAAHEKAEAGEALSASSMRKIYRDIFQKYEGPDLVLDSLDDLSGLRISHFYTEPSFYVFQYATSFAASSALSRKVLAGEKDAASRYIELLESGDSDYPIELLKKAGVDMTSPEPINKTIELCNQLLDQFEKLLLQ
jgi:oligoendopeptidase F